jgi:hypothetical protein
MATALLRRRGAATFDDVIVGPGFRGGVNRTAMSRAPSATSSSGRPVSITPSAATTPTTPNANLNAKNLPYKEAGAGNAWVGINEGNVFANIDKIRAHQTEKEGGSKQAWENLSRWSTTNTGPNADKGQLALFQRFVDTGVRDPGLKTSTALAATDWTFRDIGRGQQNKKNFLDSTFGKLLTVAAQVGATIVTGNPAAAMAIGAASGGLKARGGGWVGAAFGAAQGYGVAGATSWVANGGLTALTAPANGAGVAATGSSSVGAKVANVASNVVNNARTGLTTAGAGFGIKEGASLLSAAGSVKELLTGAAVTGAGVLAANALDAPKPDTIKPPPGPAELTPEEKFQQQMLKRRRAVATNLSWGSSSTGGLGRPTLLGAPSRLGA